MIALVAFLALVPPVRADESFERWYVLERDGSPVGWMRTLRSVSPRTGDITTRNEIRARPKDGLRSETTVEFDTAYIETPEGAPISVHLHENLGQGHVVYQWSFEGGRVMASRHVDGTASVRLGGAPPGDWRMPADAERRVAEMHRRGAAEMTQTLILPGPGGRLVTDRTTWYGLRKAQVEVFGRVVPGLRADVASSTRGGAVRTVFVDERGRLLRGPVRVPGAGEPVALLADEPLARRGTDPLELLLSAVVPSDRRIEAPASAKRAVFRLEAGDPRLPELPEAGAQRVERIGPATARLRVDSTAAAAPAGTVARDRFLKPSPLIDSDHPAVVTLAADAGEDGSHAELAERLRLAVRRHLRRDELGVGLATASQACLTRRGDCTEHAVLLAAALRARGIPARVVTGLRYVDEFLGAEGVFAFHMWTQALVDEGGHARWIDLDATTESRTDACRVALSVPDLGGESPANPMVEMLPLLTKLRIAVQSID